MFSIEVHLSYIEKVWKAKTVMLGTKNYFHDNKFVSPGGYIRYLSEHPSALYSANRHTLTRLQAADINLKLDPVPSPAFANKQEGCSLISPCPRIKDRIAAGPYVPPIQPSGTPDRSQ